MKQAQLEREDLMQGDVTLDTTVVASSHQLSAQLNDEVVVLNLQSGIYFGLTDVAARIWTLIEQPLTCASVVDVILEEFEADRQQIENDVLQFVHKMKDLGLIEVRA